MAHHEIGLSAEMNQIGDTINTPSRPTVSIQAIRFSGGQEYEFGANDKVIVVGPNNSGKSEFLREIQSVLSWQHQQIRFETNKVVKQLEICKEGTQDELLRFLTEHGEERQKDQIDYQNQRVHISHIPYFEQKFLGPLASLYCKNLGAEGRLRITYVQKGAGADGHRAVPQQVMYDNEALTEKVSSLFKKAFGKELFFDFRGNPDIPIHVGTAPDRAKLPDRVSDAYVRKVRESPRLDRQGDGMRSYAGILFEVVAIEHDITLLDEPEAFLHPPQMRRLGETLAEETTNQVFVATHSSDILRGFLNQKSDSVRIVRLQRSGKVNDAIMTSPDRLNALWEQPELRYSNALDGIFHEEVVICEDDSDCRLYNSIADHLAKTQKRATWPDTAYVPCGGKSAIPKIASALREIGVKVKVIADIDLLNNEAMLRSVVESVGGDWSAIRKWWQIVDSGVRDGVTPLTNSEVLERIQQLVKEQTDGAGLPKSKILDLLKQTSPWAMVKKHGASCIPRGNAQQAFDELSTLLKAIGVFTVPVGEAENFCPKLGNHGPKYVSKLFETYTLDDPELAELRSFVAGVFGNDHTLKVAS